MGRENLKLYFIALVPPEPVYSDVVGFKHKFSADYNSKAALRSPPHITLHMPFQWKEEKESDLIRNLDQLAFHQSSIEVSINNFGCFEPKVIYLAIEEEDALFHLQKEILKMAALKLNVYPLPRGRPFHPHMTVAFRDLKKPDFNLAWQEYQTKKYRAEFVVGGVSLLKHNGKTWDIHHESLLQG